DAIVGRPEPLPVHRGFLTTVVNAAWPGDLASSPPTGDQQGGMGARSPLQGDEGDLTVAHTGTSVVRAHRADGDFVQTRRRRHMVLADFGSGEVFLSMLWFFLFVIWFWLIIAIF